MRPLAPCPNAPGTKHKTKMNPHQFFPTPFEHVDAIMEVADIHPEISVLEPSAGNGRLVREILKRQPRDLLAVDICHDKYLKLKGFVPPKFRVWCADFLALSFEPEQRFDRVIMNPPFNPHLDVKHVLHAWDHALAEGGRLVAIIKPGFLLQKSHDAIRLQRIVARYFPFPPTRLSPNQQPGAIKHTMLLVLDKLVVSR